MTTQNYIYNKMNKDGTNSSVNVLTFDTTSENLLTDTGQISWNGDEGTFNMSLLNGSILQVGQETMFYGVATEAIPNGSVVMIDPSNPALDSRLRFSLATFAAVNENPKAIIGIATTDIVESGYGYVTQLGNINDIQTKAGWNVGTTLYYDIEFAYLKGFDINYRSVYSNLVNYNEYITKVGGLSNINGAIARVYFATEQDSAPFIVNDYITVRGVVASGAEPTNCYNVDRAQVIACTTTYVEYSIGVAPSGTTTITTAGVIDEKTLTQYYELSQLVSTVKTIVETRTLGESVTSGDGSLENPYRINLDAFDIYLIAYANIIKNGTLTHVKPSGSFLKIPLGIVILKSDNAPRGRLLARPDIAYSFNNISNLNFTNLQNNDTLRYNALGGYWFNTPVEIEINNIFAGEVTYGSTVNLDGGVVETASSTFDFLPNLATTVNLATAATTLNLGAVTGNLKLNNPNIIGANSIQNLFNNDTSILNIGGSSTVTNFIGEVHGVTATFSNTINGSITGNAGSVDGYSIWSGTQAQYDALTKDNNTLYFIS